MDEQARHVEYATRYPNLTSPTVPSPYRLASPHLAYSPSLSWLMTVLMKGSLLTTLVPPGWEKPTWGVGIHCTYWLMFTCW